MILDTSAVVAMVRQEEGHERLLDVVGQAPRIAIGTPTLAESSIVLIGKNGVVGRLMLARFLERNEVIRISFQDRHWEVASEAHLLYGKGRHPARLNYGDCMTYAIAKVANEPLLFVGDDFSQTDVAVA